MAFTKATAVSFCFKRIYNPPVDQPSKCPRPNTAQTVRNRILTQVIDRVVPEQIFGRRRENQYTRQSANPWNLTRKQARTDPRLHSFGLRVVEEWNALLDHIKSLGKVHEFQTQLRQE
jgi:hypothetical protein